MIHYKAVVNGTIIKGFIDKQIGDTVEKIFNTPSEYTFTMSEIKETKTAEDVRILALELNQLAAELDKLNGKSPFEG